MSAANTIPTNSVCPRCGRTFTCGMAAGHGKCWCAELPHRPAPEPDTPGCFCPDCLGELVAAQADQPR